MRPVLSVALAVLGIILFAAVSCLADDANLQMGPDILVIRLKDGQIIRGVISGVVRSDRAVIYSVENGQDFYTVRSTEILSVLPAAQADAVARASSASGPRNRRSAEDFLRVWNERHSVDPSEIQTFTGPDMGDLRPTTLTVVAGSSLPRVYHGQHITSRVVSHGAYRGAHRGGSARFTSAHVGPYKRAHEKWATGDYSRPLGLSDDLILSTGWTSGHGARTEHVHDYYRHTRSGRTIHVHSYWRRPHR